MADFEFVSIPHAIKGAVFFMGTFNDAGLISTEDDKDGNGSFSSCMPLLFISENAIISPSLGYILSELSMADTLNV